MSQTSDERLPTTLIVSQDELTPVTDSVELVVSQDELKPVELVVNQDELTLVATYSSSDEPRELIVNQDELTLVASCDSDVDESCTSDEGTLEEISSDEEFDVQIEDGPDGMEHQIKCLMDRLDATEDDNEIDDIQAGMNQILDQIKSLNAE